SRPQQGSAAGHLHAQPREVAGFLDVLAAAGHLGARAGARVVDRAWLVAQPHKGAPVASPRRCTARPLRGSARGSTVKVRTLNIDLDRESGPDLGSLDGQA